MATLSSGPTGLALPGPAPAPSPSPGPPTSGTNLNPLASLRKHRGVATVTALLVLLVGIPAAWKLGTPKYMATAVIYVSPRFIANLADNNAGKFDSMEQYREYVQQNVRTINRFDIVLDALSSDSTLQKFWVNPRESLEHAASRLQGALIIADVADTYQITVSLEGKKKNGLAELVNAVADTYLEKAKSEEFYGSDQRVNSLIADQKRLQKEIAEKQAKRMALAQELGVSSFSGSDLNPYDRLLVSAKESQSEAQKETIEAKSQLAVFDEKEHPGAREALHAYALGEANKDPVLQSTLTALNVRRAQVLSSLSGLSADHPGRREAERELADIEKQRQAALQADVDSLSRMTLDQRTAAAYRAQRVQQQLGEEVERQKSQASWFTHGYQEGIQLGLDVDEARRAEDSVRQRIDYFTLEKSAPGFVRLFSSARVPDEPIKGGRKMFLAAFLVLALALAVAVPMAIDFLDPRLRSPNQVESLLEFPLTAWLMEKEDAGPAFEREQILRFANRIVHDKQANRSRIFAFTSVKSRGGTSTIVLETARALRSLGMAALAVEANSYSSDPRYFKPGARGLAAVLAGTGSFYSEIIAGDEELPDRIPVGEITAVTSLPGIKTLDDLLNHVADHYDVILIDAPPILVSVDAEMITRLADAVVLVIEAESVNKAELRRAARSLERLQVRAISTLFNRVRRNEASGLAATAAQEFLTGSAAPPSRLLSPWLWR
jgi:succinoglycan biosynthesis transport protein ExoP